ncbi:hypothetical protein BDN71DRAFT_1506588 [Pleurotus eryngii]|uniref:Uncharacterized protein n=1 Tax=Pleurotus eryngii TaxID=5323 RepID=A0A9P6DG97_PLEER|nr:hypothetical protein BDN71DRAFT_1506588 [Pleurotus eryngii]
MRSRAVPRKQPSSDHGQHNDRAQNVINQPAPKIRAPTDAKNRDVVTASPISRVWVIDDTNRPEENAETTSPNQLKPTVRQTDTDRYNQLQPDKETHARPTRDPALARRTVVHVRAETGLDEPIQHAEHRKDVPYRWRRQARTTEPDGSREEQRLDHAEGYVEECEDRVIGGSYLHAPRQDLS